MEEDKYIMKLAVRSTSYGLDKFEHIFLEYKMCNVKRYNKEEIRSFEITLDSLNQLESIAKNINLTMYRDNYDQMRRGYYENECFVISCVDGSLELEIYNGCRE